VDTFVKLGIALGLGLIVGLERERAGKPLGGIRTFPLITVLGTVCALLGRWVVAVGLAGAAALLVARRATARPEQEEPGLTTDFAALLMYGVGAWLVIGPVPAAVAVGGAVALLLHGKSAMHAFAQRIGERDVTAIMRFVLVTLVILQVLPDRAYDPYDVLNPYRIWLMVALIVGINLAGYGAYRLLGRRRGALVAGTLGGFISSTATTVAQARSGASPPIAALVIQLASTVVFLRVLIEVAVAAPGHFGRIAPPVAIVGAGFVAVSLALWLRARERDVEAAPPTNPAELKPALLFGAAYALVLFATAAARDLGTGSLYVVAVLSGLTDMDAITLSTSRLVEEGRLGAGTAWRAILVAMLANLAFKAGVVGVLGGPALLRRVALLFGLAGFASAGALFLLWP
jgi:uncharacterized membrane protein (DUF4010 family)